jgi:hypothetical protein
MVRPPGNWLMAVLHAYFDNSGDDKDCAQKCLSVCGYLGTIETWQEFETNWSEALRKFGIPYLRLKEFGEANGIYSDFSKERIIEFLSHLVAVIAELDLSAFGSTVRLGDLRRFNSEQNLDLDACSLALHECCHWMGRERQNQIIEAVVDRIPDAHTKITIAERYSRSGVHAPSA